MKFTKLEKKQLLIFGLTAYALPYLLGLLMWYGYKNELSLAVFPNAQMLYPAAGVMLAYLLTKKGDSSIPGRFYICFLAVTGIMAAAAVLSVIFVSPYWNLAVQLILVIGSILSWILLLTERREKREAYGLRGHRLKASVFCVVLFVLLYLLRTAIPLAISGQLAYMEIIFSDVQTWIMILALPINFLLAFVAFFGEEYGWRYYLQPMLQKRFGLRTGVIILGILWGLWHLPINFFYYSPGAGLISAAGQQITCITLGIFFAYAYMKTDNIWVPVILHYLNNNLIPILSGNYSADVLQNQSITWASLLPALILNGLAFGFFLLAKPFRRKKGI